ncbi:hypothetical protein ACG93R_17055 [Acinetobacter guillouiae]|uniref:hypothetical protein n=1 Tax=Acinetobacter guillouiae TaxID=106649 RepID=UPI003AF88DB1
MKVLVHDGLGFGCVPSDWNKASSTGTKIHQGETMSINAEQLQALIQGLAWQRIGQQHVVNLL